jgi:hypothetical protein
MPVHFEAACVHGNREHFDTIPTSFFPASVCAFTHPQQPDRLEHSGLRAFFKAQRLCFPALARYRKQAEREKPFTRREIQVPENIEEIHAWQLKRK